MRKIINLIVLLTLFISPSFSEEVKLYDLPEEEHEAISSLSILMDPDLKEFYFSTHILSLDEFGIILVAALANAAERGVRITGIIDNDLGNSHQTKYFLGEPNKYALYYLSHLGIQLGFYNPVRNKFKVKSLLRPIKNFTEINRRWHDKIFAAFYYSKPAQVRHSDKNWAKDYFGVIKSILPDQNTFRGRGVVIEGDEIANKVKQYLLYSYQTGPIAKPEFDFEKPDIDEKFKRKIELWRKYLRIKTITPEKREFFESQWKTHEFNLNESEISHLTAYNENGKSFSVLKQIFDIIDSARPGETILIENPYFVLFPELRDLIIRAKQKNCPVVLLTNSPSLADSDHIKDATEVDLKELSKLGVDVYYLNNITHAKTVHIGNRISINSSANFDPRSYRLNNESGFMFSNSILTSYNIEEFWKRAKESATIAAYNRTIYHGLNYTFAQSCLIHYRNKKSNFKASFGSKVKTKILRPFL